MGTNVMLVAFNKIDFERFQGYVDDYRSPFYKEKLRKICTKLQVMAAKNGLVVPNCFKWFAENEEKEHIPLKFLGMDMSVDKVSAEYCICLNFDKVLSDEEFKQWWYIVRAVQYTLQPNI